MKRFRTLLQALLRTNHGTIAEYAVIIGFVVSAAVGAASLVSALDSLQAFDLEHSGVSFGEDDQ